MLRGRAPNLPWIQWKKQLELLEAKHAMQAEGLRQVRAQPGLRREGRLRVRVEAGPVQKSGWRWECLPLSLIEAPLTLGRTADRGGLDQLPGAERSPAGAAPSTLRAAHL